MNETMPEGMCQFKGRIIDLLSVPKRAHQMEVFDNVTCVPTGETFGDVVTKERERRAAKTEKNSMKTIWLFNINRRVYPRDENGKAINGPIYREHWEPCKVIGETKQSWLIEPKFRPRKVPKKGGHGIAFSEQEVDDDCWVNSHRSRVADRVNRLQDAAMIRTIAQIVGYEPDRKTV